MHDPAMITTIDISKQARALVCLRVTDYVLVVICGYMAVTQLSDLVVSFQLFDITVLIVQLIISAILCFATYTAWRQIGVIDLVVWRTYRILLPLLVLLCLFVAWTNIPISSSNDRIFQWDEIEVAQLFGIFLWLFCVTCAALFGWASLMLLRRMRITAIGSTIDEVVLQLTNNAGVRPGKAAGVRRLSMPRGLLAGACGTLLLLALIAGPRVERDLINSFSMVFVYWGAFFLLVGSRRFLQFDADSLLAVDRRAPILYLRSFGDDEKTEHFNSVKAVIDFSLETRFFIHFSRYGPFVAIGSPSDSVPQLGAARVRLADDEWQTQVVSWIKDAELIIMVSGRTHWVTWELRKLVEYECATRLILMIPEIKFAGKQEISRRLEQLREVFKDTPWKDGLSETRDFGGLRAIMFRPDGSIVNIKSRSRSRESYHLAALIAHYILIDSTSPKR